MFKLASEQRRQLLEKLDALMLQPLLKAIHQPSTTPMTAIER